MSKTLEDLRLDLSNDKKSKEEIFDSIQKYLDGLGLTVTARDFQRPWGGFFVIDEQQARKFGHQFFPTMEVALSQMTGKLSPKILVVQGGKRLSWQYHFRRAEIWKLVAGNSGIVISSTDEQSGVQDMKIGEVIQLSQGQRHRLVGTTGFGMVAEIWQHTDPNHPSDEEDIVRLQDDFGR